MVQSLGPLTPQQQQLLGEPAGQPPPGTVPFSDVQNLQTAAYVVEGLCLSIAISAVGARLYVRGVLTRSLRLEDLCIVLGLIAQITNIAMGTLTIIYGVGKHMWDITLWDFIQASYWVGLSGIMYGVAIFFIKLAIPLQFLNIFAPHRNLNFSFWLACWVVIIANALFYAINVFVQIFQCSPREKSWNPFVAGHCLNLEAIFESTGIVNVVSDFALLVLPMHGVLSLRMSWRQKLKYMAIFSLGFAACVASIVRTVYTWQLYSSSDVSWELNIMGFGAQVEITLGVLIFCIPSTPHFFSHVNEKIHDSLRYLTRRTGSSTTSIEDHEESRVVHEGKGIHPSPVQDPFPEVSLASFEQKNDQDKSNVS